VIGEQGGKSSLVQKFVNGLFIAVHAPTRGMLFFPLVRFLFIIPPSLAFPTNLSLVSNHHTTPTNHSTPPHHSLHHSLTPPLHHSLTPPLTPHSLTTTHSTLTTLTPHSLTPPLHTHSTPHSLHHSLSTSSLHHSNSSFSPLSKPPSTPSKFILIFLRVIHSFIHSLRYRGCSPQRNDDR
jgi:hypothetical protein